MQENRSFDHYFGGLRGVRGRSDPTSLRLQNGASVFQQPTQGASSRGPFHLDGAADTPCPADLDHSWNGTHAAWNNARWDGWVATKGPASMGYLNRADIPLHYALADGFTVCDNYFCSVMGPTNPNRLYLWSATIDPDGDAAGPATDNSRRGFGWTTYPERLQAAGVSWKVYQNAHDNFDDNALAWFTQFQHAQAGTPLYERGMASVAAVTGSSSSDIAAAIEADARNGTLPVVSWVVAPEQCSEHPGGSPAAGADFIARVLGALTADPQVWASTVLLINYDENDGFFDHVPPPVPAPGTPDEFIDGLPIGLGPRVPMFAISPWSRGGYVCSQVFDHTSVIRFLEVLTGVVEPNISQWRRQVCGDLTSAFDFTAAVVSVPALPSVVPQAGQKSADAFAPVRMDMPAALMQEPGNSPARPLPYQANAVFHIDSRTRCLCWSMSNSGTQSVHLAIYPNGDVEGPRQYDISAHDGTIQDRSPIPAHGTYDVSAYGPNGFLRRAAGDVEGLIEISLLCVSTGAGIAQCVFRLTNAGAGPVEVTIGANVYGNDGARTYALAAGQTLNEARDVYTVTDGWYDFSATLNGDATFLRRFAGHVETGLASVTGIPSMSS
jgi:phospholipase C